MGVWDLINSATDKLKQNAPDLTPVKDACRTSYGYSCTAVSKINKNAPHLTPVKSVCGTFYDYSCVAVSKIHNAVRVDGLRNLYGYWPDDETRGKIGLFTTKFTQNAADYAIHEGIKSIPGGVAVSKIVSKTLRDVKSENHKEQAIMAAQAKMGGSEQNSGGFRKSPEQTVMHKQDVELDSLNTHFYQNPEDILKMYTMTEFEKRCILTDLIIGEIRSGKKHKQKAVSM